MVQDREIVAVGDYRN